MLAKAMQVKSKRTTLMAFEGSKSRNGDSKLLTPRGRDDALSRDYDVKITHLAKGHRYAPCRRFLSFWANVRVSKLKTTLPLLLVRSLEPRLLFCLLSVAYRGRSG